MTLFEISFSMNNTWHLLGLSSFISAQLQTTSWRSLSSTQQLPSSVHQVIPLGLVACAVKWSGVLHDGKWATSLLIDGTASSWTPDQMHQGWGVWTLLGSICFFFHLRSEVNFFMHPCPSLLQILQWSWSWQWHVGCWTQFRLQLVQDHVCHPSGLGSPRCTPSPSLLKQYSSPKGDQLYAHTVEFGLGAG